MEYASADPSVVRSIRHRVLLNAWLRALSKPHSLPMLTDFDPETRRGEFDEMMAFDVEDGDGTARFLITQEGSRLTATYGSEHILPEARTNRYLDDAIGADRYVRVVSCYLTCVARKRPTYSITTVRDPDDKEVSYERLLLPFGRACDVEQIIGAYNMISIEGNFTLSNLMGHRPMAAPKRLVNAVIDREPARRPAGVRASDDIVEVG